MQSYCDRCNESADHPISIVEDVEVGALAADLGYRSVCEGCYDDLLVEAKEAKEHEADDRRAEHRVAAELHLRVVPADVSGVRALFRALKEGEAVGFLPDQVPGEGEGDWADFFGRPAYTMTLAAKLAEREGVCCFLVFGRRLPRGRGYAVRVRPLPEKLEGESATRRLNRALEELVRECPGQYLWGYNRYKVPKGARPL